MAKARGLQLYGLTLDYGQRHQREIAAARALAKSYGFKRQVVFKIPLNVIAAGGLLAGKARPAWEGDPAGRPYGPSVYVTFRNGVFLSLAVSFAEAVGAREIWGGWCGADRAGFPDCRGDFLLAMEKAANLGTAAGRFGGARFRVRAPLAGLDKAAVIKKGLALGVDFSRTWTCYRGGKKSCGKCMACRFRREGFRRAGIIDPL
jgi:7-cyano-7-deazaguanine synthase